MPKRWLKIILALTVALASKTVIRGNEADVASGFEDVPVTERLAMLEAEVRQMRQSSQPALAAYNSPASPSATPAEAPVAQPMADPAIGSAMTDSGGRVAGLIGGAEVVFLKPFYTGNGAPNQDAAASDPFAGFINYPSLQYGFKASPRLWLGFVGANGLGCRFRYFEAEQSASTDASNVFSAPPGTFTQTGLLALKTYDLELTQRVDFENWSLTGFGGIRYAQSDQQSLADVVGTPAFASSIFYHGIGLTGGMQAERALSANGRWSALMSCRGSMLFGSQSDITNDGIGLYTNEDREIKNTFASIWEMSFGPQWKIQLPCGGEFFVRASVEGQLWQGVGSFAPIGTSPDPGLNHNDYSGSFGLLGLSSAVGITR